MATIILAAGHADLNQEIEIRLFRNQGLLKDRNVCDLNIVSADTVDQIDARLDAAQDVRFVIVTYDLEPGERGGPSQKGNLPVALARRLEHSDICTLILGPITEPGDRRDLRRLRRTDHLPAADIFDENEKGIPFLVELLVDLAEGASRSDNDEPTGGEYSSACQTEHRGIIELTIEESRAGQCRTRLIKDGFLRDHDSVSFKCDRDIFIDLEEFNENLKRALARDSADNVDGFLRNFRSIGRKTRQMVLATKQTNNQIRDLIGSVNGAKNVSFRFHVPHRAMPSIPFEAILRCDQKEEHDDEFQIALAPVCRIVNTVRAGANMRTPLAEIGSKAARKLNCLVIDASTDGQPLNSNDRSFPYLHPMTKGTDEANNVFALFQQPQADCLQPKRVSFDDAIAKADPIAHLDRTFRDRRWDIVHFVGHSYFQAGDDRGPDSAYIFLPGEDMPVPVSIMMFADWLEDTSFVFLSSCQSAEAGFIHALAEKGIPEVIGYRWSIPDTGAKAFAEEFYRRMLQPDGTKSVETAFAGSQKALKDPGRYMNDTSGDPLDRRIWAYPMLVMQNVA